MSKFFTYLGAFALVLPISLLSKASDSCFNLFDVRHELPIEIRAMLVPISELQRHTQNGYVFNGKSLSSIELDFAGSFNFVEQRDRGYGIWVTSHYQTASAYAESRSQQGISIFAIAQRNNLRVMRYEDIMKLPEVVGLEEHVALKTISQKYDLDIIVHHTGALLIQKPSAFFNPTSWQSYLKMYTEWVINIPELNKARPKELFNRYADAYSYALTTSTKIEAMTPLELYSRFIQKLKLEFPHLQSDSTRKLFINWIWLLGENFSKEQIDWLNLRVDSGEPNSNLLQQMIRERSPKI